NDTHSKGSCAYPVQGPFFIESRMLVLKASLAITLRSNHALPGRGDRGCRARFYFTTHIDICGVYAFQQYPS
ncbi:MAG: hypothetical protein WBO73_18875, partial [Gammaproteobacteria bacterium]